MAQIRSGSVGDELALGRLAASSPPPERPQDEEPEGDQPDGSDEEAA